MQTLKILLWQELVLALGSALGVLEGCEEYAQTVDLYSLALQQHLEQTRAELLEHSEYHVGSVDRAEMSGRVP